MLCKLHFQVWENQLINKLKTYWVIVINFVCYSVRFHRFFYVHEKITKHLNLRFIKDHSLKRPTDISWYKGIKQQVLRLGCQLNAIDSVFSLELAGYSFYQTGKDERLSEPCQVNSRTFKYRCRQTRWPYNTLVFLIL